MGEQLYKPSYVCIKQEITFRTAVFRSFGQRKLTKESLRTLLARVSNLTVLNFVPATRITPIAPAVPLPYSEPSSLWTNYHSNDDVDIERFPTVRPSPPALPSTFHDTTMRTQVECVRIPPYRNSHVTSSFRSNVGEHFYGTFDARLSGRSWQEQTPARTRHSSPDRHRFILLVVFALCASAGIIAASMYYRYVSINALCRWVWSESQGTWVEKVLARTTQAICWSVKTGFKLAKTISNWIWQRL